MGTLRPREAQDLLETTQPSEAVSPSGAPDTAAPDGETASEGCVVSSKSCASLGLSVPISQMGK